MSKLYVFGIGGTGSRVLKSLTMLLATGVECKYTIVPIVIDRDLANADSTRTKTIIDNYIAVNKMAPKPNDKNQNRFFSTDIHLLNDKLFMQLEDNEQVFSDFIDFPVMTEANKALVNVLFSEKTLQLDMTEGFQGNPNIGSVVLNQFEGAGIFQAFANDFQQGDRIFIISSIFGGTGASGFPLLLKNLSSVNPNLPNWGYVQNAPTGAITVLPYFSVSNERTGRDEDSLVDSDTFIDKTKAALSYYTSLDKKLDVLYYIADGERTTYGHSKGGNTQKNDAHFVELASALAIVDFANLGIQRDNNNNILQTTYKEFGLVPGKQTDAHGNTVVNQCKIISFSDLADDTKKLIRKPMIQFYLFRKYLKEIFDKVHKYQPYARKRFDDNFMSHDVLKKLESFQDDFYTWLSEMNSQNRGFRPFKLESDKIDPFEFVADVRETKKGSFRYKNWAWMDNELNEEMQDVKKVAKSLPRVSQFLELFYRVTDKFVNEIVKI